MIYRVVVSARAMADTLEAFRWLADRSPAAAARWHAGLEKAIANLAKLPERHPIATDESEQFGFTIRQMIYGRKPGTYRILFSVEDDRVVLHYIRHSARSTIE